MTTATVSHLYQVGDQVVLDPRAGYFLRSDATFTVVAQLPALGSNFQYRIKSIGEPCQRMVLEHQLTRADRHGTAASGFFKERGI